MQGQRTSGAGLAVAAAIAVVVLLAIAYILSSGPAAWLVRHSYLSYQTSELVYAPLYHLADACRADRVLESYLEFWDPMHGLLVY
jgi:hypothetical protein